MSKHEFQRYIIRRTVRAMQRFLREPKKATHTSKAWNSDENEDSPEESGEESGEEDEDES